MARETNPNFMAVVPELMILRLLQTQEMYGYEIVQAIRAQTGDVVSIGEGVAYTVLHALEREGAEGLDVALVVRQQHEALRVRGIGPGVVAQPLQRVVDALGREVRGEELKAMFWKEYVQRTTPWALIHFHADGVDGLFECRASMLRSGQEVSVRGRGNGPIAAFVHALAEAGVPRFEVTQFKQHSLSEGEAASAIAYIQIRTAEGATRWGAGVDTNIELASIQAVISALNRL